KFREQEKKRKEQIDCLTKLLYTKEKDKYKAIEIEDATYNTIRYFRKESAKKSEELRKLKQQIKQYEEDQEAKKAGEKLRKE
ncbi:1636_t:CDS:1, partial [Ambispora leptoticha]